MVLQSADAYVPWGFFRTTRDEQTRADSAPHLPILTLPAN